MENNELGSLAGALGSAALGLYGFLSQLPYLGSFGLILMGALFAYYFNARIQNSTHKYERLELQTTEVLGPVYGQVTRNLDLLEKKKAALDLDLGAVAGNEWDSIEHSYRVELIDGRLRSSISQFFFDSNLLRTRMGQATEILRIIEEEVWRSVLGTPGNAGGDLYYLIDNYRHERSGLVYAAVFWEKDPAKQFNMKWKRIEVAKGRGSYNEPVFPDTAETPELMERFFAVAWKKAGESLDVVNARAEYERILKEGYNLRENLQKRISQWAKP